MLFLHVHKPQENLEHMMTCIRLLVMHYTDESSDNKLTYFKQKKNYLYLQKKNGHGIQKMSTK